jgi:hypothetical protein
MDDFLLGSAQTSLRGMDSNDPAAGVTRVGNAGLALNGLPHFQGRQWGAYNVSPLGEEHAANTGEYSAPVPSYQRYLVGPVAADVDNRSLRSMNREY